MAHIDEVIEIEIAPELTDWQLEQLEACCSDEGCSRPAFRERSIAKYGSLIGVGSHDDNSPEMRNPSIHSAYLLTSK